VDMDVLKQHVRQIVEKDPVQ